MYIIRDVFIAKPGQASKLAKLFKDMAPEMGMDKTRVLTDFVSNYNQVIMETEIETLSEFEKEMESYRADSKSSDKKMTGYQEMYYKGYREILRVVD